MWRRICPTSAATGRYMPVGVRLLSHYNDLSTDATRSPVHGQGVQMKTLLVYALRGGRRGHARGDTLSSILPGFDSQGVCYCGFGCRPITRQPAGDLATPKDAADSSTRMCSHAAMSIAAALSLMEPQTLTDVTTVMVSWLSTNTVFGCCYSGVGTSSPSSD